MKPGLLPIVFFLFSLLFTGSAFGQKTDVVHFPNGDRLYGEVRKLDRGLLYFKTMYMGTEDIEWNDIIRLETDKLFLIQLKDGRIMEGTLDFPSTEKVTVTSNGEILLLTAEEIVRLIMIGRQIWNRFEGEFGFGVDFTQANSILNLNAEGELKYQGLKWISAVGVNSIFTMIREDDERYRNLDVYTEDARIFARSWLAIMKYSFQINSELGYDSRHLLSAGFGVNAVRTQKINLIFKSGVTYNRERFTADEETDQSTTNNVEWPMTIIFEAFTYDIPEMDVEVKFSYIPGLTGKGRHRFDSNISMSFEFVDDFLLKFTFYDNFDNQIPDTGEKSNDYGFITSIAYSFD